VAIAAIIASPCEDVGVAQPSSTLSAKAGTAKARLGIGGALPGNAMFAVVPGIANMAPVVPPAAAGLARPVPKSALPLPLGDSCPIIGKGAWPIAPWQAPEESGKHPQAFASWMPSCC
jgi:hypothetical protein